MAKIIKDIKVVGPEDKLIFVIDPSRRDKDLSRIVNIAEDFLNTKGQRVMCVIDTLRPYIIKRGAKVSLIAIFEQMLKEEEHK